MLKIVLSQDSLLESQCNGTLTYLIDVHACLRLVPLLVETPFMYIVYILYIYTKVHNKAYNKVHNKDHIKVHNKVHNNVKQ